MARLIAAILMGCTVLAGCGREMPEETEQRVATETVDGEFNASAPGGRGPSREEIEQQRFNQEWRKQASFQQSDARRQAASARAQKPAPAAPSVNLVFVNDPQFGEALKGADPKTFMAAPIRVPIRGDVSGPSVLKAQVLLARSNFSVGPIDGRWGKNSEIAVHWFQDQNGLEPTGEVDEATFRAIAAAAGEGPVLVDYAVTPEDLKGPFVTIPEDVYEQVKLDCLCYESVAEKLAETFHVTREMLELINPQVRFDALQAGQTLLVPAVGAPAAENAARDIDRIAISIKGNYFHGHDASGRIVFHSPTTLGSKYDPSPTETLKTVKTAFRPHFTYQPKLFADVPDDEPEAYLPPGPNSPVGLVWIALSKPHYGIHGTSNPDSIGYAASHGCVRLTNWDALDVARRTADGTRVDFVDTRH